MNPSTPTIVLVAIFLVPLALAGMALTNTGLGRGRGAAHSMLAALATIAIAACVYCLWGYSWEGVAGQAGHSFSLGGKPWNWIASDISLLRGPAFHGSRASTAAFLQVFTVGMAALIPLASGAERWRLNASLISTTLLAGWIYPLFGHWVWGGGWLSQLGANYGLGEGFLDAGGASVIQVVGGLSALSATWILGPRLGRPSPKGKNASPPVPAHNLVYVLFGCFLMLPGWIGLNVAGSLLFGGELAAQASLVAVNTFVCASAACLTALATTGMRFGKPDASLSAGGWIGGLVTSSALCAFVTPEIAIFAGLGSGVIVALSIEFLEMHLNFDDPGGAIPVHVLAGIWGLLATGLFVHIPKLAGSPVRPSGQLLAQLVGVATLIGFVLPMTYALNWLLNRVYSYRVDRRGEEVGMDLQELGGEAYPRSEGGGDQSRRY